MSTTTEKIKRAPKKAAPPKYKYREEWLNRALLHIRRHFVQAGYEVPDNIRVTCGWPSQKALGTRSRRIGECWSHRCSGDKTYEIIVSLYLSDAVQVIGVLIHEVVHATVGVEQGHNAVFGRCARAVGLTGKLTATTETPELRTTIEQWVKDDLGTYPHAKLDGARGHKKQSTRLLKMVCDDCECIIRTTQTWIDEYGTAWDCPCGGRLTLDV